MSSRFTDDLDLVAPGEYVPTTVQTLLAQLHLEKSSRKQQEAGIRDWLTKNPPGRAMTYSLRRKGFGNVLDTTPTSQHPVS